MKTLRLDISSGVATVTMDSPDEPVNTINEQFSQDFDEALKKIGGDGEVRAAVITSAKKDSFHAGADVKTVKGIHTAEEASRLSGEVQQFMQRIRDLPIPVVAAISGSCLGGGLELALACDARVATDDRKTKLGLPEVQLGLIPGAGGTQYLPRLIGLQQSLDLILTGKQIPAKKAKKLGLVDEIAPAPLLHEVAAKLALSLADHRERDQQVSPLGKLGSAFRHLLDREELQDLLLEENPLGRKVLFDQARKRLLKQTRGNYPAPEKALEAVRIGASQGLREGLEAEARFFGEMAMTPQAAELIRLFLATTELKKDTGVDDPSVKPRPVEKVGVLGAGLMGAGIAYVTADRAGTRVRLKDVKPEAVGRGLKSVRDILDERVKKRRMTPRQREETMALVSPTVDYRGFGSLDVVVEAVFEDLEIKQSVLRDAEAAGRDDVIFASNTSTIPISKIAEASKRPETVIGMHYFSPVHKMPLLEVIVTDKTAPWVTATCVALGKRQGKTVIVVKDGVGFYTSRILGPYMNEAFHIMAEGVKVEAIDAALLDFGFPVGPVKLLDEVGIDVAYKASKIVAEARGETEIPEGLEKLMADERYGRKNKKGFYLYGGKKKGVDQSVYQVLGIEPSGDMPKEEIARRCVMQMVNEAAKCWGEGILRSRRDGDIGAIFGLGFPPFRGGPFRYIEREGPKAVLETLRDYEQRYGARYAPAPALEDLVSHAA